MDEEEYIVSTFCMLSASVLLNFKIRRDPRLVLRDGGLGSFANTIKTGLELAKLAKASIGELKQVRPEDDTQIEGIRDLAETILVTAHDAESRTLLDDDIERLALGCLKLLKPEIVEKNKLK